MLKKVTHLWCFIAILGAIYAAINYSAFAQVGGFDRLKRVEMYSLYQRLDAAGQRDRLDVEIKAFLRGLPLRRTQRRHDLNRSIGLARFAPNCCRGLQQHQFL